MVHLIPGQRRPGNHLGDLIGGERIAHTDSVLLQQPVAGKETVRTEGYPVGQRGKHHCKCDGHHPPHAGKVEPPGNRSVRHDPCEDRPPRTRAVVAT